LGDATHDAITVIAAAHRKQNLSRYVQYATRISTAHADLDQVPLTSELRQYYRTLFTEALLLLKPARENAERTSRQKEAPPRQPPPSPRRPTSRLQKIEEQVREALTNDGCSPAASDLTIQQLVRGSGVPRLHAEQRVHDSLTKRKRSPAEADHIINLLRGTH
jgi:hypothetical protein